MSVRVPQPHGTPGWLLLSHEEGQVQALFVDARSVRPPERIQVVLDPRVCSDSVFRVIRLSPNMIAVADIWVLNGTNIHGKYPYVKRSELLAEILDLFHSPDLTALIHPSELPVNTLIRGHEGYDDQPGSIGVFLPASE